MNDDVLEAYVEETRRVGERIDSEIKGVARLASASVAVAAIGTLIRLDANQRQAGLIMAPFALTAVLAYVLRRFVEINALGGYKGYLENRINNRLDENVMLWDGALAGELFSKAESDRLLRVIYACLLLASAALGIREMWSYRGALEDVVRGLPLLLLALVVLLARSAREFQKVRDKAARLATEFGQRE